MKLNAFVVAAVAAAGMFTGTVHAAPLWTVTTQGLISSGFDTTGVFGVAKRDLAGLAYTQTIIANVDPSRYHLHYQSATENNLYGTDETPAFTLIDSVDGHTVRYEVTRHQEQQHYLVRAALTGGQDAVSTGGFGWDATDDNYLEAFAYASTESAADSFVPTLDFGQSFTAFIGPEISSFDRFYVAGTRGTVYFGGDVQVLEVVASNSVNVPEPASTALFGAGLLGLIALRRYGTR